MVMTQGVETPTLVFYPLGIKLCVSPKFMTRRSHKIIKVICTVTINAIDRRYFCSVEKRIVMEAY